MTFLVNLMFRGLDKFDGPIIEGGGRRAYIRDANWVTYIWGSLYTGGRINGILRY